MIDPISFTFGLVGGGLCVLIACKAKRSVVSRNQMIDDMDKIVVAQDLADKINQVEPKSVVPMSRAAVVDMLEGRDYSLLRWFQWLWIYICSLGSLVYYPIHDWWIARKERIKREKQLANDTLNRFLSQGWRKI